VATGAALAAGPRVLGANEEIRLAVIGCGIRSGTHIAEFGKLPGVRIVAVCDPDRVRLAAAAKSVATKFNYKPDEVVDVRRLMERKDLRGFRGDDAILARAADDLGLPDRPARLCGEAAGAFHLGGSADGAGGAEV